jgi:hypothetical protein
MIEALQICGFRGQELKDQLLKTEAYPFPLELINTLLPN